MIEAVIRDYLKENGIKAYLEEPEKPPAGYVIIERTGNDITDRINTATFALQSYGPTLYDAAQLNEQVVRFMDQITARPEITGCHLSTFYNFTDQTTKRYRYQAVFLITHY